MDNAEHFKLQPDEIEIALKIWLDLKHGVADAHNRLQAAPEHIRDAILEALVIAIDKRGTMDKRRGRDRRGARDRRGTMDRRGARDNPFS